VDVRPAAEEDLQRLTEIYNHYVINTQVTFDIEPRTLEQSREWLSHYKTTGPHRLLVAVDSHVLGFASSSPFRPRAAYATSIETSVYTDPAAVGRGIGTLLYETLFEAIRGEDVHRAYAGIALPNDASIAIHERFGFSHIGTYTEVGRKLDRYWDVAWYEKRL
jgi:phosphinothricin acetyltransferase